MRRFVVALGAIALAPSAVQAQQPAPSYFQQPQRVRFVLDGLLRQEWTTDLSGGDQTTGRRRARLRAGLRFDLGDLSLGVGGDFNYSSDQNPETYYEGVATAPPVTLVRDNYRPRDARLDLAFARLALGPLEIQGGRFEMPLPVTEMIWDKDLRPQGGAVTLATRDHGRLERIGATALWARGSHVYDDDHTSLEALSAGATLSAGQTTHLEIAASFLRFRDPDRLEVAIRRQNTRVNGEIVGKYEVADALARLRSEGPVHSELVAELCWNTAADTGNRGLWLALVLGSTEEARGRLEYVYSKVDKDATLGAYPTDDFLWTTGWEGHKADLGLRSGDRSTFHVIGQLQRFKDGPTQALRDRWIKRLRLEIRFHN
jgi:hypothetical protein